MSPRSSLALTWIFAFSGCGTSTTPMPVTPATVPVTTPDAVPPPAVVTNDAAPIATLLGKPVLSRDCLSQSNGIGAVEVGLHSLILGVLMEDILDPQSQTLSQTEIDAVWQRFQAAASMGGKALPPTPPFDEAKVQARLDDVRRKLAAPNLPWLERLTLQGQERGSVYALEHKSVPVVLAYDAVMPMRYKAALYKKYGGKVVAMQISMEPAEAFVKLVQEAEASGKLQFHNEGLKQAFWKRMNDVLQHSEVPPERVDFSLPAWLHVPIVGPAPVVSTPSAALDFDRWVGVWETIILTKPTASLTKEQSTPATLVTRKVFDDRFLMTHSASESDPNQFLWLMTSDQNFKAYRLWIFSSGGETFERRGQWDAAGQTLTMQLQSPVPGVTGTSVDRFVGDDRIESTLLVKAANGKVTRDVRWTAQKKSPQPETLPEIPTVDGPASAPEELSQLQDFAGDWTIQATFKPSVWIPDGKAETMTEKVAWVLGGRFLMARTFNEQDQLMSIWLATYESKEKSNHFWFFNADGSSGQWRVTADDARGFQWKAIDMPSGWLGAGSNRRIDDDTFGNEILIKDEHGRVLLEGSQDKQRIK